MLMPINYKKYPPNWKSEIRPAILERAKNKCEFCGFANGQTVFRDKSNGKTTWHPCKEDAPPHWQNMPIKVVLTIAHLDHDEHNHNVALNRLAALCQLCHLQYDAKEKAKRVKVKNNMHNENLPA
jgi:hypothetical protein